MPKVSVIIPTYNRASLLKRAIKSVLAQTFLDFEIIVVDDGSIDKTKEVVDSFGDPKIKYVWQENSGGAAKPKNTGIKIATGEYIGVLDSDDEWLPEKLQKQMDFLKLSNNHRLGVVGCDVYIIEGNKKRLYKMPRHKNISERMLITDDLGTGSSLLYKKEVFDKVGLFDENLKSGQDREMRVRLGRHYDFGFVPEPLVNYHYQSFGIATGGLDISKREKDWQYIFEKYKADYLQNRRMYSDKLRYDGTRYMMLGYLNRARKSFISSIARNPLNFKSYAYLVFSLGGRAVYGYLTKIKLWIKQNR